MPATATLNHPLQDALALADAAASVRAAATALRERYPGLRIVVVDAFDMRAETPAATGANVVLWYGASDGHCWTVTSDPAQAAGLFIASTAG
jgi:hypothetical protein